ncbi:hypothetical protein Plhal304r1_c038g0113911 [Plasmopara halstedii]
MSPHSITLVGIVLRGLQLTFALVAVTTTMLSFPIAKASNDNFSRLGSFASTFILLVSYTVAEYAGVFIILIEIFFVVDRPNPVFTRILDSFLTILVLVSGIKLASSDYVQDCEEYAHLANCSNLIMSSIFTLSCVIPLFCSIVLTFKRGNIASKYRRGVKN